MINLDLSLSQYHEKPTILPNGLRSFKHVSRFKAPAPVGLFGDLELLAGLSAEIDRKELARLDQDRKAGSYLRAKLKGVPLPAFHQRVLNQLVDEDAEYHARKKATETFTVPKGIDFNAGLWRVRKQVDGKRVQERFPTLTQATAYLDRL